MTAPEHGESEGNTAACECALDPANAVMCVCDHNPGAECHCAPFESKCDQRHHLAGAIQTVNSCCQ
jgi:hypothetical protein